MSETNDLTTRMFTAANIIDGVRTEFAKREGLASRDEVQAAWSAYDLRTQADRWDREDAVKADEDAAVEDLAVVLWRGNPFAQRVYEWFEVSENLRADYRQQAREVLAAGYRMGGAS